MTDIMTNTKLSVAADLYIRGSMNMYTYQWYIEQWEEWIRSSYGFETIGGGH